MFEFPTPDRSLLPPPPPFEQPDYTPAPPVQPAPVELTVPERVELTAPEWRGQPKAPVVHEPVPPPLVAAAHQPAEPERQPDDERPEAEPQPTEDDRAEPPLAEAPDRPVDKPDAPPEIPRGGAVTRPVEAPADATPNSDADDREPMHERLRDFGVPPNVRYDYVAFGRLAPNFDSQYKAAVAEARDNYSLPGGERLSQEEETTKDVVAGGLVRAGDAVGVDVRDRVAPAEHYTAFPDEAAYNRGAEQDSALPLNVAGLHHPHKGIIIVRTGDPQADIPVLGHETAHDLSRVTVSLPQDVIADPAVALDLSRVIPWVAYSGLAHFPLRAYIFDRPRL